MGLAEVICSLPRATYAQLVLASVQPMLGDSNQTISQVEHLVPGESVISTLNFIAHRTARSDIPATMAELINYSVERYPGLAKWTGTISADIFGNQRKIEFWMPKKI